MLSKISSVVILTGAGISAESGLATFRASDGLWCGHKVEDVATPEAFKRNPELVHDFYNQRRAQLKSVQPNAAHLAIAEFAKNFSGDFLLVTQNVDDLHDRAHSQFHEDYPDYLIHMHGELNKARCLTTEKVVEWRDDLSTRSKCNVCGLNGCLRPHIVWFGEMPLAMPKIERALSECDLFISIGTSGNVYPAAGFVQIAKYSGAHTVELNLEPSLGTSLFDETHHDKASKIVPEYLVHILNGQQK